VIVASCLTIGFAQNSSKTGHSADGPIAELAQVPELPVGRRPFIEF
jgi:hypothetical protein